MSESDRVLSTYHRAIARHYERTGISYPMTRTSCVEINEGKIYDTNVWDPQLVATFTFDALDRVRVRLV